MLRYLPIFALIALVGCADLRSVRHAPTLPPAVEPDVSRYRLGCADVVSVTFAARPEWDCIAAVDVDGCLVLGTTERVPVQGKTTDEARHLIEREVGEATGQVTIQLLEARSAKVFVTGPDNKRIRAYSYSGPTPVLDFLQEAGAIVPKESKLNDVYILRSHVAEDKTPRLFQVDVEAVVYLNDPTTNLEVQPSDHIFVGETRRASFSRLLPPWIRPAYRRLWGLLP